jgi:fatty-acyl-CoA synthase
MNVSWWVERWAELTPLKPAVVFEGETATYLDLNARVDQVCRWLQCHGLERGDRVAVVLRNCPEFLELYLACARLGAVFVPLNWRLGTSELRYLLADSRPRVLVYDHDFAERIPERIEFDRGFECAPVVFEAREAGAAGVSADRGGTGRAALGDYTSQVQEFEGLRPIRASTLGFVSPEDPQVIMYTSGTTGRPKGAVLSHRKTFFNCLNAEIFFEMSQIDRMLVVTPLFHSGALFIQVAPCLYKGATMFLHARFDPDRFYEDVRAERITKFQGVPTIYRMLLRHQPAGEIDLSSLEICAVGGEPVTGDVIKGCLQKGFPIRQVMGQTETSILLWANAEEMLTRPGTLGRPVFHAEVDLMGKEGARSGPREVGELVVRGSITMSEYWNAPEETARAMSRGWLRTGDLAWRDEDGYYYMVDRATDMYISGGENVYPAEVENVFRQLPDVNDVAVVGVPHEVWGETGHAFIVVREGSSLSKDDALAVCRRELAGYKVPGKITFLATLPRTASGKVRKHVLREMLQQRGEVDSSATA